MIADRRDNERRRREQNLLCGVCGDGWQSIVVIWLSLVVHIVFLRAIINPVLADIDSVATPT